MSNLVVVGGQWGDEGKAKIIDLLSEKSDIVIRYQGGCNAGHTVVVNDQTYKFHLIPSGILYPGKICLIGNGTVINPQVLMQEIDGLKEKGIDASNLFISPSAHLTLPYHLALDELNEELLGNKKIGTTKRGIGPTYADKINRTGIRVEDIFDEKVLNDKLDVILPAKNAFLKCYDKKEFSKAEILEFCKIHAEKLKSHVKDLHEITRKALEENQRILFEGAQGAMLDIDHGTYPFVTSSNPIAANASIGSGVGFTYIKKAVGVFKAYVTRVGEGPFITELNDDEGKKMQQVGKEIGTTTGRTRRCGWFDAVVAKYSVQINGLTSIALTKSDVFDTFDEIKICTAYKDTRNGDIYEHYPTNLALHEHLEPVYELFEGWNQDITGCKTLSELPENAIKFINRIEELAKIPVSIVSVGPGREQTIIKDESLI